mgnify:FL=1
MSKEKICAVCYKSYEYCPVCGKNKDKPAWMFTFCSENCHDIYLITSSYANHKLTANKAKNKLDKLDLSGLNDFGGSYQNVIADINANVISDKIGDISTNDSIPTDTTNNLVKENINKYEKIKYSPKKKG